MPLIGIKPANVIPVAKATNPVNLLDDDPSPQPLGSRPFFPRQPHDTVTVSMGEATRDILLIGLLLRDLFKVADETQAGQVRRGPGLVVRQVDVLVPPRQGERDVRASFGVQCRCRDCQGQDRGISTRLFTRRDVFGKADGSVCNVRWNSRRCDVLGEYGGEDTGF